MPRTGIWLKTFVVLLFAAIPPILLVVAMILLAGSLLSEADPNVLALIVVIGSIVWAAVLAILYVRVLTDDFQTLVTLAERGEPVDPPELGAAYQQLAAALEERNRQVTTLAHEAIAVPIDDEPTRVVRSLVAVARSVTRDTTWRCAVLYGTDGQGLPLGSYGDPRDDEPPAPIGELERWASVAASEVSVVQIDGPWGAFAVVNLSISDRVRAILLAPWEGRGPLSAAESAILALVGQHAGSALEHSLLYTQVRNQADELHRMAAIQADFLRGVTHDLQTPLTSIGALATELRASKELSDASRADLDTITHQAERLRRMVSQLLVASRLEAGGLTPQTEVFGIHALVERTWAALRADRPFELNVKGAPHLAVGDPDRFEQVLWAVLDNAVKYSPDGTQITTSIEPLAGDLSVTVTDQGTGMDESTVRQAFDQFYRAPAARKLAPDGSGVGLYAARGLMEAMGGAIEVRSSLGQGTSVTLRLPGEPSATDE